MIDWNDTKPDVNVLESEYKRLLGFPADYVPEGRVRELIVGTAQWYAEHGRPWIHARETVLEITTDGVRLNDAEFTTGSLHKQFTDARAGTAVLAAVSAGKECEEKAGEFWQEGKPDEYFFMEMYGSAVVEHLVTKTGARICAWAEENGMAALPHYSPGYSGWDTADQTRLFEVIQASDRLPGELHVMESGMLKPKKSLLAVFGATQHVESVRQFSNLVPCENCSFSPCQYRRARYRHALPQIEDVKLLQPPDRDAAEWSIIDGSRLDLAARYSINSRALRKWSEERLELRAIENGIVEARFRYEGTTCSNLGRPLAYEYVIQLDGADYRILEATCTPAAGDTGYAAMCEFINNGERLSSAIARENPLAGRSLNDVLSWKRPFSPAGCYCDAESRLHKWGLVLEVIHYALARREQERIERNTSGMAEIEVEAK